MAAGSGHGAQAIGMKESEARTDEAAVPAVAETAASGAKTVATALLADPVPDTTTRSTSWKYGSRGGGGQGGGHGGNFDGSYGGYDSAGKRGRGNSRGGGGGSGRFGGNAGKGGYRNY
jgi:hypothetical protein